MFIFQSHRCGAGGFVLVVAFGETAACVEVPHADAVNVINAIVAPRFPARKEPVPKGFAEGKENLSIVSRSLGVQSPTILRCPCSRHQHCQMDYIDADAGVRPTRFASRCAGRSIHRNEIQAIANDAGSAVAVLESKVKLVAGPNQWIDIQEMIDACQRYRP